MSLEIVKSRIPHKIAAPSWVMPGTVAENCGFLNGKVDEVALLFFETKSCLEYTDVDLPERMADKSLTYHIHHPLDLPWHDGGAAAADVVLALNGKADFLSPCAHVVHPPQAGSDECRLLRDFALRLEGSGIKPEQVLIENIRHNDLQGVITVIEELGFKICLDLGHILAYGQQSLLKDPFLGRLVHMLHLNAPGEGGKHECLTTLDVNGRDVLQEILYLLHPEGTVTIELFDADVFFKSLQFLNECYVGK